MKFQSELNEASQVTVVESKGVVCTTYGFVGERCRSASSITGRTDDPTRHESMWKEECSLILGTGVLLRFSARSAGSRVRLAQAPAFPTL